MKQVAFLACASTMPSSPNRRADAFEHDAEFGCFEPAFRNIGRELMVVQWDDNEVDWARFEAAIIRTTWDYTERLPQFLSALDVIQRQTRLLNRAEIIRWNANKRYLADLSNAGVPVVPSVFLSSCDESSLQSCFARWQSDCLVVKRVVGASAIDQVLMHPGDPVPSEWRMDGVDRMVQAFQPAICSEGELSLVFFGKELSHAIRKRPAPNDYRVQSLYDGTEEAVIAPPDALKVALQTIQQVPSLPLYSRVDLIRPRTGELAVLELELIEPYLYPTFGQDVGGTFARSYQISLKSMLIR